MKTHQIVFRKNGEVSYTPPSPSCLLEDFDGDLEQTANFLLSSDDWRLIPGKLYSVSEVTLPDWVSPKWWCRHEIEYKYFMRFVDGAKVDPDSLSMAAYERIQRLRPAEKFAVFGLLKVKKFRSDFRRSLRAQLDKWLSGESDFPSPFSRNQWACLINGHILNMADRYHKYGQVSI